MTKADYRTNLKEELYINNLTKDLDKEPVKTCTKIIRLNFTETKDKSSAIIVAKSDMSREIVERTENLPQR